MPLSALFSRLGPRRGPVRRAVLAAILLALGLSVVPALIYGGGLWLLGRYEGAGLARTYGAVYGGLSQGSIASWVVVLGPCGLWLIARGLRAWWRASAKLG
jgi:hypothetical protein